MALVLVLVVVAMLTLGALTFSQIMMAERMAAGLGTRKIQSQLAAESGIVGMQMTLTLDEELLFESGGMYNNPDYFQAVMVADGQDSRSISRFTILTPLLSDDARTFNGVRYGVEDESSRLSLNLLMDIDQMENAVEDTLSEDLSEDDTAVEEVMPVESLDETLELDAAGTTARDILMQLPGMTEDVADAILDWMDPDDVPREFGAEIDYYSSLTPPYSPRNGPLQSIDEMLLIRGVTPTLLFGCDLNHNGLVDMNEGDPVSLGDADNSDGSMNRGWSAYLTIYTGGSVSSSIGTSIADTSSEDVINLNMDDLDELYKAVDDALGAELAAFVIGYRKNGPYDGDDEASGNVGGEVDTSGTGSYKIKSVFDLVQDQVEVQYKPSSGGGRSSGSGAQSSVLESPISTDADDFVEQLEKLVTSCWISDSPPGGQVNINQAPRTVLLCLPGMTEDLADRIIAGRIEDPMQATEDQDAEGFTWLFTNEVVTIDEIRAAGAWIGGSSDLVRFQSVGFYDSGNPACRLEVLMDISQRPGVIVYTRNLTKFGAGYSSDVLGAGLY